jgi:hypothetical protein
MPGYDNWKTRSPDDDLGDPSVYEAPSPEQEEADYLDSLQQLDANVLSSGLAGNPKH